MKVFLQMLLFWFVLGCVEKSKEKTIAPVNQGYVLKHDQGTVFPGSDSSIIVKASPELGS
jgi:hypothetical protein